MSLIREKLSPENSPTCCGFDALGEGNRDRPPTSKGLVQFVVRPKPKLDLQRLDIGDTTSQIHAHSVTPKRGYATPPKKIR